MERLEELGRENLAGIVAAVDELGIDARYEPVGVLDVATREHEVADLEEHAQELRRFGHEAHWLDRDAVREEIDSPTYLGGVWQKTGVGTLDPARLAWGLAAGAESLGARIHEATPVLGLDADGSGVSLRALGGRIRARRVVLATSAFPPLVRSIRRYIVPVYDYVLVTEPLSAEQRAAIGWQNRQGAADSGNQFHYYRLTSDDRILWGGYDAVYNFRNGLGPHLDQRPETFEMLARNFFATFPQLEGISFTHRWGGAIDTCSRFCMTFGKALGGKRCLHRRLHRPRRRCEPFRRARGDRARGRRRLGAHASAPRADEAASVPAGADPLGGHHADAEGARPRRRDRQARSLAAARSTASASASTASAPSGDRPFSGP